MKTPCFSWASVVVLVAITLVLSCGTEPQQTAGGSSDAEAPLFRVTYEGFRRDDANAKIALPNRFEFEPPVKKSRVAIVFPGKAETVESVKTEEAVPVKVEGKIVLRSRPLGHKKRTDNGQLIVEIETELGRIFRPRYSFYDAEGNEVGTYKAEIAPNRRLLTIHGQRFGTDEPFVRHDIPAEHELQVSDDGASVDLEEEYTLWVENQFLGLGAVGCLPNNTGSPIRVAVTAECGEDCYAEVWAPIGDSAEYIPTGSSVGIEPGACLTLGVSSGAKAVRLIAKRLLDE